MVRLGAMANDVNTNYQQSKNIKKLNLWLGYF